MDVAVATLWSGPNLDRPMDKPSLTNPVDIDRWLDNMSLSDRLWLVGNLQTQALYGHKVHILEERGDWVKVAVPGQPTPKNPMGYPGWIPAGQLTQSSSFTAFQERSFALVDGAPTVWLYDDRALSEKFIEISFNTRLPVLARARDAVLVATPTDGVKWLSAGQATVYRTAGDIPDPSGDDLVATATAFENVPYLWAGRSGFGFDCSGFTSTVYHANGVTIPRDSAAQATYGGAPVDRERLHKGDLIFYAYDHGEGYIHHVGMYLGDGKQIDAPINSATEPSGVQIVELAEHRYADQYWGAMRY